jgi:hypothetical protein
MHNTSIPLNSCARPEVDRYVYGSLRCRSILMLVMLLLLRPCYKGALFDSIFLARRATAQGPHTYTHAHTQAQHI